MIERITWRWLPSASGLAIVAAAAALAIMPLLPGRVGGDPAADGFSSQRAQATIERIATEPRPIGSPGNARARAVIVAELERLGLRAEQQRIEVPDYYAAGDASPVQVVNVVARLPGTASTGSVALVGHYDTMPTTFGANDDASAVALELEVARAILAGPPPRNDVLLVLTDGEEPAPRYGASAFVAAHPAARGIAFVINLESIGSGGPSMLIEAAGPDGMAIDRYAAAVPRPAAYSFLTATTSLIGGSISDFATFRDAGVPGVELAYLRGSPIYHTPADSPDRVDRASLQHHGESALALTRYVADLDLGSAPPTESRVFHTVGWLVVGYPASLTLAGLVLAALVLVLVAVAGGRRGRGPTWRGIGRGLLARLLAVAGSVTVAIIAWELVAGARGDLGVAESYLYLGGLVAVVLVAHVLTARLAGPRDGVAATLAAPALWWLLALLLVVVDPGIGYLLVWPTLAAGVAVMLHGSRRWRGWLDVLGFGLVATTAIVLILPAIDTFYQLAQPRPGNLDSQMLWMVAVPALLVALLVELLVPLWPGPVRQPTP